MKIIFKLNHPAHYHLFKHTVKMIRQKGHVVILCIKDKDILKELLEKDNESYTSIIEPVYRNAESNFSILTANIKEMILQDYALYKFLIREKPDLLIGTDTPISHVGWFLRIPSFIFNEDDFLVNKLFCSLTYPFAKYIVSPNICKVGVFRKNKIGYDGYQKLAYLHPSIFSPDKNIVLKYLDITKKYFIIRIVSLSAGHDLFLSGMNEDTLDKIIEILSKYGDPYITSEKDLPAKYDRYKLRINVNDIHHVLAYAALVIADGQSMIVEAAILGVPSIRYNSATKRNSVLEELETYYGLTVKIHNTRPDLLMQKIFEHLKCDNLADEYHKRKEKMIAEKISLTDFLLWLFSNYPDSIKTLKKDKNYQRRFLSKSY